MPVSVQVGQVPVRLKKEIDGFALNRVQAAILAESWRLVQVSAGFWGSGQGLVAVLWRDIQFNAFSSDTFASTI